MGKSYDSSSRIEDFISLHNELLPHLVRVTKPGGSICWQIGYFTKNSTVFPLDYYVYQAFTVNKQLTLRNRIIWTFGHGLHGKKRFSGRHEVVLWFTKGDEYQFDLDSVRIPQKWPGKTYYKGTKKGEYSGNPLGKNPGDVWEIPNVNAQHIEKTEHPCQFPVALAQRLVKALTPKGGRVLDPFMGSGSAGCAALIEKRKFVGIELNEDYFHLAFDRCKSSMEGSFKYRPLSKPILKPVSNLAVAKRPSHFVWNDEEE
jgi:adenine-specific DNA-methyltransferase